MPQDALRYEEYPILPYYQTCPADELFDYMADTLLTFAELHGWCVSQDALHMCRPSMRPKP